MVETGGGRGDDGRGVLYDGVTGVQACEEGQRGTGGPAKSTNWRSLAEADY